MIDFKEKVRALTKEKQGQNNMIEETLPEVMAEERNTKFDSQIVVLSRDFIKACRLDYEKNRTLDNTWASYYSPGTPNFLVASTNDGKTTFIASSAVKQAANGHKVLVILSEDSIEGYAAVMPSTKEDVLKNISMISLPEYSKVVFENLIQYAKDNGIKYVYWDYVESSAFETRTTDEQKTQREIGHMFNTITNSIGKEMYFFAAIQSNRSLTDAIRKISGNIGKQMQFPGDSEKREFLPMDALESIRSYIVSEYMRLIDGGVPMAQRAKSMVFSFKLGGLYFHLTTKQKSLRDEADNTGELYRAKMDKTTGIVELIDIDSEELKYIEESLNAVFFDNKTETVFDRAGLTDKEKEEDDKSRQELIDFIDKKEKAGTGAKRPRKDFNKSI